MTKTESKRLLALDVFRGITIAGMIMVNNAGNWNAVYAPLKHAGWNGLTPADLVFPFFMFIMGISTYISLRKFNFQFNREILYKIAKRTIVIFLIGLMIAWIGLSFRTYHSLAGENISVWDRLSQSLTNFSNLRILGVMQRLAITYCITSLIAVLVKHKYIPYIIATTLIGYFLLMLLGNGMEYGEKNILAIVDKAILGSSHMNSPNFEVEGILSTIPALCNVLIGFLCGKLIIETKDNDKRMAQLFIVGAIMTFVGLLLAYGCPINKRIWSSTYVLATCGMGASLLALMIWIIDIKGHKKWSVFFESFGVNPLFIYVFAEVLAIVLSGTLLMYDNKLMSIKSVVYKVFLQPYLGDYFGSLIYSILFVLFVWMIGHILYKKRIYIKI